MKIRFEAGDLLAFLYALVLVREGFWVLPETLAWVASFVVAALLAVLRLRTRTPRAPLPVAFWIGVGVPMGIYWAIHLPYPDVGFDNLSYHLLHGERALRGLLHIPGDFYPYYYLFLNPAPDILSALFRAAVGYRLGTIGGLLVTLWTGAILYRILEPVISSRSVRAVTTLWIVATEGILWEVGNYMVDLYSLPLLLEAALIAIPDEDQEKNLLDKLPHLGLLLGASVALKLTNLVFVAAIGAVYLANLFLRTRRHDPKKFAFTLVLGAVLFLLPAAPHMLYLTWTTGSPIFPNYNSLFRSPYYTAINVRDGRFGPESTLGAVTWPVVSAFHPERLSELGRTSGRLALAYLAALAVLFMRPKNRRLWGFSVLLVAGSILWSFGAGISRYGIFAELLGGLVLILLAAHGVEAASQKGNAYCLVALTVPVALLGGQSLLVANCLEPGDWGGRATALDQPKWAWKEIQHAFQDRDLKRQLPPEIRQLLPTLGGWVDVTYKTSGLMALLDPRLPQVGLRLDPVFEMPANQPLWDAAMRSFGKRPLAALVWPEEIEESRKDLARRGFVIQKEMPFELPMWGEWTRLQVVAVVVEPSDQRGFRGE
ncbi:MAG: hypothetical protein ACHQPI_04350 [Thermoanaerobaculia bacterium]